MNTSINKLLLATFLFSNCGLGFSQGDYCIKLLDEADYYESMTYVIECLGDVGNYELAIEKNEELRTWLNSLGSNSPTASV